MKYTLPPEYLFEKKASLEEIRQKNYSDIDPEDFDRVMHEDPTYVPGSDQMGTFGKQLMVWFKKDPQSFSPHGMWKGLLAKLMEMQKSRTLPAGFQINQYPDMDAIRELVAPGSVLAMKVSSFDPTEEKKYIPFLSRMYKAEPGRFDGDDERGAMRLLGYYDWNRLLSMYDDSARNGVAPVDLDSVNSFFDFKSAMYDFRLREDGYAEHHKIIHQGAFLLVCTLSKFANEMFGFGTKWCTTWESLNYFQTYASEGGPLIQSMPYLGSIKETVAAAKEDKYQFYCRMDGTRMEIEDGNKGSESLSGFLMGLDDAATDSFRDYVLDQVDVSSLDDLTTDETRYGDEPEEEEEYETQYFFRVNSGHRRGITLEIGHTYGPDNEEVEESYEIDPTEVDLSRDRLDPVAMAEEPLSVWKELNVSPTHLDHAVGFEEGSDVLTSEFISNAIGYSQDGIYSDLYRFRNGSIFSFVWKNPCGHSIEDIELAKSHEEDFFAYIGECHSIGDEFYVVAGDLVPYSLAALGAVDLYLANSLPAGWKELLPEVPKEVADADDKHRFLAMHKAGMVKMSTLTRFMSRAAGTDEWTMDFPLKLSVAGSDPTLVASLKLSSLKPAGGIVRVDHPSQATFPAEEFEDWQPVTNSIKSAEAPTYRHELNVESLVKTPLATNSAIGLPLSFIDDYVVRLVYWISRDFGTVSVEDEVSFLLPMFLENTNGFRKTKTSNVLLVDDGDSDEPVKEEDPEDEIDGVSRDIRDRFQSLLRDRYNRLSTNRMSTSVGINSILDEAVEYFIRGISKGMKSRSLREVATVMAKRLLDGLPHDINNRNIEILIDRLINDLALTGNWG